MLDRDRSSIFVAPYLLYLKKTRRIILLHVVKQSAGKKVNCKSLSDMPSHFKETILICYHLISFIILQVCVIRFPPWALGEPRRTTCIKIT